MQRAQWRAVGCRWSVVWALLIAGVASGAPVVSPHLKKSISTGSGTEDFLDFPPPAACSPSPCSDQRVMVAKLVVNETAEDLVFEVLHPPSGTLYPITQFSTATSGPLAGNKSVPDTVQGVEAFSAFAQYLPDPVGAGYKLLKITIFFNNAYSSFPAGNFLIRAGRHATKVRHLVGFKVDGATLSTADPLVTKPHLIQYIEAAQLTNFGLYVDLPATRDINFGQVHINLSSTYVPDELYEFRNVGTAPLTISAANPSTFPAGGAFTFENYPSPPLNVQPMDALQRRLTCQPTAQGVAPAVNVQLTTNAGNLQVNLACTGIVLNSAILFDISDSMREDKFGNYNPPKEQQKIYPARTAALELANIYNTILPEAKLGLYTYPNREGGCPSSEQIISMSTIKNNINFYNQRLNNNNPDETQLLQVAYGPTPMAEGISRVWSVLNPQQPNTRSAVFQIGDGQHYCDSAGPRRTAADWYNSSEFQNAKIPFFTIPYGPTGAGWLQTFQALSQKSGGETFAADIMDELELQKQFKKALGKALDLETLTDPNASVQAGATAQHNVCVSGSTYQLILSVHWLVRDPKAVEFTVETPDRTILTPASVAANPGHLSYSSGQNFATYVVRGKFLQGDAGSGIWKLRIKGNTATSYVYQVYAQDRMKGQASIPPLRVNVPLELQVMYPGGPYSVAAAAVTARYEAPSASFNNYLARTPVTPELMARIPKEQAQHMSVVEKKQYVLTHFLQKPFVSRPSTGEVSFGDVELPRPRLTAGVAAPAEAMEPQMMAALAPKVAAAGSAKNYQRELPIMKYDGRYNVLVKVIGLTTRGQCFQREYSVSQVADVRLSKDLIFRAVKFEDPVPKPFFDEKLVERIKSPVPEGYDRKLVTFTPTNESEISFGIGRAADIDFKIENAERIGPVVDNLDGSYSQAIEYKKGSQPKVTVAAGEAQSDPINVEPQKPVNCHGCGSAPAPMIGGLLLALLALSVSRRRKVQ
jgi:uncharacterized protein (TIGR03382 family)